MKKDRFLVLTRSEVESLIGLKEAIPVVEKAFQDLALGKAFVFPVIRERIDPYGGFFGVKAGYLASQGYLGYKGGGFWKTNLEKGIAGHQSVILLYHPETGMPMAAMDGNFLTIIRTGAVGAIAAKYLARKNSKKIGIIGTGTQGKIQLTGLLEVFPIQEVHSFDLNQEANRKFSEHWKGTAIRFIPCPTAKEAVEGADVIVTTTPSFQPVVKEEWILPGVHINAIGSDTKGKQEIDQKLLGRAKVVVDSLSQARELGECQHAFRDGIIHSVHAELGEIVARKKPGRENDSEITLFDATGIALQDLAVAAYAYERALARNIGTYLKLD
jgi:alanine dehydrogenase